MSDDKKKKIEWLNHFVGFVSVVLGVLMAFWLNSWNESRKESGSIETAANVPGSKCDTCPGSNPNTKHIDPVRIIVVRRCSIIVGGRLPVSLPLRMVQMQAGNLRYDIETKRGFKLEMQLSLY